jgi:hypothetical protein
MDERNTTSLTEPRPEQPVEPALPVSEPAFARGSRQLTEVPSVASERTENSVMEGLPAAKAERIASMRRELAELQRQLTEAQQRIATELQGRADDAERLEALEARLQANEVKAQQDAARTDELVAEVASLRSQGSSATATAEEVRRELASHDAQIEEVRQQHRAATEQLEAERLALNEAKTTLQNRDRELEEARKQHGEIIATRDSELAAITSERDALKTEIAAAHARARDVANQLARVGHDLMGGVGGAQLVASSEPSPSVTGRSAERPKPPPVPLARAAAHTEPREPESILEVTEESKSKLRLAVVLVSGVILGCVVTIACTRWTGSSASTPDERADPGATPSSVIASPRVTAPVSPSVVGGQTIGVSDLSVAPPTSISAPDVETGAKKESDARAPAESATDGVIVLPQEAEEHRVYVDGHVVRVKNSRAVVPCGTREIRIGSRGTSKTVGVVCGGETTVPADTPEH